MALSNSDRLNLEQIFLQAEAQNADLRAANIKLQQSAQRTTGELTLLHEKFDTAQSQLAAKQQELLNKDLLLTQRSNEITNLKSDLTRLLAAQNAHTEELNKLRTSNQEYVDRILKLNIEVSQLSHTVGQLEKQNIPLNFRIEQLEAEKKLLQQHQTYLETTLQTKSSDLFTTKTSLGNELLELEAKFQKSQDQNSTLEMANQELKQQIKELNITIQKHLESVHSNSTRTPFVDGKPGFQLLTLCVLFFPYC